MSDVVSFTECDKQHPELLPPRTVLSASTPNAPGLSTGSVMTTVFGLLQGNSYGAPGTPA